MSSNTNYIRSALYKNKYLRTQIPLEDTDRREQLKDILSTMNLLSEIYELRSSVMVDSTSSSLLFQEKLISSVLKKNGFDYITFEDDKINIPSSLLHRKSFFSKSVTLPPVLFM